MVISLFLMLFWFLVVRLSTFERKNTYLLACCTAAFIIYLLMPIVFENSVTNIRFFVESSIKSNWLAIVILFEIIVFTKLALFKLGFIKLPVIIYWLFNKTLPISFFLFAIWFNAEILTIFPFTNFKIFSTFLAVGWLISLIIFSSLLRAIFPTSQLRWNILLVLQAIGIFFIFFVMPFFQMGYQTVNHKVDWYSSITVAVTLFMLFLIGKLYYKFKTKFQKYGFLD